VEQIKRMLRGRVVDLQIVVGEECVMLRGIAANYHGKQLAQHYVWKAFGVTGLVNQIEVRDARDLKTQL
jgi:hypothetical protein